MKTRATCKGCGRIRLINLLGLCKRCNQNPSKFLSAEDIAKAKAEAAAAAAAAAEARAAEAAEEAAEAAEAAAEGAEEKPETEDKE